MENHMETKEEANLGWDDFPCSSSSPPDRYVSSWRPWGDNNRFCSGGDLSHCVDPVTDGWTEFNPCSNGELEEAFEEDESDHKYAGLINLGNTCFLNAVLQCLTYTAPLANTMLRNEHNISCQSRGFCGMCAMEAHIKTVLSTLGGTISPSFLANNLTQISKSFVPGEQQDAHECFFFLIEVLQKCSLSNGSSAAPKCMTEDTSFVSDIFIGQIRSQVRCNSCSHSSDSVEAFLGLSLEVESCHSVEEALSNFMAVEELQEDSKVSCSKCKEESNRSKQLSFDKSPQVLVIQLKRFKTASLMFPTKIEKNISYGTSLDLTSFNKKDNGVPILEHDWKYRLYAVLVHSGWCTTSGHYYCYVQTSPGIWHWMNDSVVTRVSETTVLRQEAYMLFYIREGVDQVLIPPQATSSISEKPCSNGSYHVIPNVVKNSLSEVEDHEPQVVPLPETKAENVAADHSLGKAKSESDNKTLIDIVGLGSLDHCFYGLESSNFVNEVQITEVKDSRPVNLPDGASKQPSRSVIETSINSEHEKKCQHPMEVDQRSSSKIRNPETFDTTTHGGSSVPEQSFRRLLSHMPSRRREALLASTLTNVHDPPRQSNVKTPNRALDSKLCKKQRKQNTAVKVALVDDAPRGLENKRNGRNRLQEKAWQNDCSQEVVRSRKLQRVVGKGAMNDFIESGGHHQKIPSMVDS